MNSEQIFKMALVLERPWHVKNIEMLQPENGLQGQIDIYLDFVPNCLNNCTVGPKRKR